MLVVCTHRGGVVIDGHSFLLGPNHVDAAVWGRIVESKPREWLQALFDIPADAPLSRPEEVTVDAPAVASPTNLTVKERIAAAKSASADELDGLEDGETNKRVLSALKKRRGELG